MSQVMAGYEINSVPYSAELWLFVSLNLDELVLLLLAQQRKYVKGYFVRLELEKQSHAQSTPRGVNQCSKDVTQIQ